MRNALEYSPFRESCCHAIYVGIIRPIAFQNLRGILMPISPYRRFSDLVTAARTGAPPISAISRRYVLGRARKADRNFEGLECRHIFDFSFSLRFYANSLADLSRFSWPVVRHEPRLIEQEASLG